MYKLNYSHSHIQNLAGFIFMSKNQRALLQHIPSYQEGVFFFFIPRFRTSPKISHYIKEFFSLLQKHMRIFLQCISKTLKDTSKHFWLAFNDIYYVLFRGKTIIQPLPTHLRTSVILFPKDMFLSTVLIRLPEALLDSSLRIKYH